MAEFVPVPPFDLVVFGASGDLAMRKLFPSLLHRYKDGQIPADSRIVGVARQAMDRAAFHAAVRDAYQRLAGGDVKAFLDANIGARTGDLLIALVGLGFVLLLARFLYRRQIFLRV